MKIEIILSTISVLICLHLAFFKSYFQEKGKNIATSEDIEELTHKVESVKQNFIEKNASLKAKLDLLTNLQINHKNDERTSLIDFHRLIKRWIGLLTESSPSLIDDYDNQEVQVKIHQYNLAYGEVLGAEALLELYINDVQLQNSIHILKIKTLEYLAPHPLKFLTDLKYNNFEFKQIDKMQDNTEENITKKSNKHSELLEKRKAIFDTYRSKMTEGYKEVINYDKEYRTHMKEYISKISKE